MAGMIPEMQFDDLYSKFIAETYDRQSLVENPAKILVCTTPRTAGHSYCRILQQFGLGIPCLLYTSPSPRD